MMEIKMLLYSRPVLSTVPNQKPPLLEPKPAKTRPKNFYQKTTIILGQTATILEILKWRSWIFCKYLLCSPKNVKILLFSTRPQKFSPPHKCPKPPLSRQPATIDNTECAFAAADFLKWRWTLSGYETLLSWIVPFCSNVVILNR